ncbi:MAG: hypothetical protein HYU66_03155, partial [Armatimonadetes bacterium]|nr:hypothetical protein [Armatimonadota bacterium]
AAGQTLVLFDQDYPAFDSSWLPGGVKGSDDDFNEFRLAVKHPLLEGLPPVVRVTKIVNDALSGGDAAWLRLTEPWGLSVRKHGQGEIILCQLRLEETWEQPASARLLRNLLAYARRGSRLPMLMLDEGNGEVPAALSALGLEEWVGAEEAGR